MSKFATPRDEELYRITLDGWCESSGDVESPVGWFALVEDYEDCDWIVREDTFGFVDIEGPFDHIDIDTSVGGGYYQPARRRFEELCDEYGAWMGDDEEGEE